MYIVHPLASQIIRETYYDIDELKKYTDENEYKLNNEKSVYK